MFLTSHLYDCMLDYSNSIVIIIVLTYSDVIQIKQNYEHCQGRI